MSSEKQFYEYVARHGGCYNEIVSTRTAVLKLLSDGKFHAGTEMGETLGISRAAVNKAVKGLVDVGLDIHRVSGRGYRIVQPVSLLDKTRILAYLDPQGIVTTDRLYVLEEVDSTSAFLSARAPADLASGSVCVAEYQSRGRGRRGRSWVATPYTNIMMSMAWRFDQGPTAASGLSLAAAVAVIAALRKFGIEDVGLKWPNDILWRHRKLAGLLLDVQGEVAGPATVILGLGINVHLSERDTQLIDQPWVDLRHITGESIDRNRLFALLVGQLTQMFEDFSRTGLPGFREQWEAVHLYVGQRVRVLCGAEEHEGRVVGIDDTGALQLRDGAGHVHTFHSGEVSLRPISCVY